jgi:anti-sigma28 factor (negative regulator of flagellin synthesis)
LLFKQLNLSQGNQIMRGTVQSRLNRAVFVGYHPAVTWSGTSVLGPKSIRPFNERRADMDVSGLGSVGGVNPSRSGVPAGGAKPAGEPVSKRVGTPEDELELSAAGRMSDGVAETAEMRAERLAQIKAAINDGSYDTDEKLDAALSRMFNSMGINFDDE